MDTSDKCYHSALRLLARRAFAVAEMRKKLLEKKFAADEVEVTVERLLEQNFLNDKDYAVGRIRYRAETSFWGAGRIHRELKEKGVAADIIEQAFDLWQTEKNDEDDWQDRALDVLLRKKGAWPADIPVEIDNSLSWEEKQAQRKEIEKEKQRRLNFLMRKGFSMGQARAALEACLEGRNEV